MAGAKSSRILYDWDVVAGNDYSTYALLTWADPADNAADTVKNLDISAPDYIASKYLLVVAVDDTLHESDFTCQVFSTETLLVNGTPRTTAQAKLATITVPKIATVHGSAISAHAFVLEGLFAGGMDVRLAFSNDSALTEAVTLDVRLRELSRV